MELYTKVSKGLSKQLTLRYSTSFGLSSRLFAKEIRNDIFAIYGLVRIADEIVDTYRKRDMRKILDELEQETYAAMKRGYSTNPIVHSFAITAQNYSIERQIIEPFFDSMRFDITKFKTLTQEEYKTYIYGSAEVVGLMCLRVFCNNNASEYESLKRGAQALGSAYQKVNFLRDVADDHSQLKRMYFPGIQFMSMSEADKTAIVADISEDFMTARVYIKQLPIQARTAVFASYLYYSQLLKKIEKTDIVHIKQNRVRIPNTKKILLLAIAYVRVKLHLL